MVLSKPSTVSCVYENDVYTLPAKMCFCSLFLDNDVLPLDKLKARNKE